MPHSSRSKVAFSGVYSLPGEVSQARAACRTAFYSENLVAFAGTLLDDMPKPCRTDPRLQKTNKSRATLARCRVLANPQALNLKASVSKDLE